MRLLKLWRRANVKTDVYIVSIALRGDSSIDARYQVFKALPVERVMKSVPSWGLE